MTTEPALLTDQCHLVGPALRVFFRIARKWRLSADEQRRLLGYPARSTFYRWRREHRGRLSGDTMERISCVIGIYGALHAIFSDGTQADSWVRRPNAAPQFSGQTALQLMIESTTYDLRFVRRYLDGQIAPE